MEDEGEGDCLELQVLGGGEGKVMPPEGDTLPLTLTLTPQGIVAARGMQRKVPEVKELAISRARGWGARGGGREP